MSKTTIIVNPAAGRGRGGSLRQQIQDAFGTSEHSVVVVTRSPGEEEQLARVAIENDSTTIVAVGGDGTCSRIAGEILRSGRACRLAVVPTGTGNDFAKTMGVAGHAPQQIADLVSSTDATRIDVGLADNQYFLNSCGFGFAASVLESTQRVRFLKGDALYIYSALAQLFSYRSIDVTIDGALRDKRRTILMAIASNGRSLGGAFRIAPTASVTDGKLDFCLFADNDVLGRVRLFAGALRGRHLALPGVTSIKGDWLSLTFADNPAMEMDGELRQATSRTVRIECVPKALSVVAAPGAPL